jgi:hypothetical protein
LRAPMMREWLCGKANGRVPYRNPALLEADIEATPCTKSN